MTGGHAYTPVKPFDWYVFGGFDGQLVAHDITLDGNTFESGPSVPRNWLVGDLELGAAVVFNNWRVSYTQVFETHTFVENKVDRINLGHWLYRRVSKEFRIW
jgi:hypothetical protein